MPIKTIRQGELLAATAVTSGSTDGIAAGDYHRVTFQIALGGTTPTANYKIEGQTVNGDEWLEMKASTAISAGAMVTFTDLCQYAVRLTWDTLAGTSPTIAVTVRAK